ncbi:uncharacterized protein LOC130997008 [Salvia miltiorrhiza]|uniref:uncharacterized protein LOC130997008 n=1 Tax=Salvia miltiorrhiza TaxID=226208 RepID=UPI0025AD18A8|nr:uncharacterized protein LOC130997008 [Salvia miltiorrhiza]
MRRPHPNRRRRALAPKSAHDLTHLGGELRTPKSPKDATVRGRERGVTGRERRRRPNWRKAAAAGRGLGLATPELQRVEDGGRGAGQRGGGHRGRGADRGRGRGEGNQRAGRRSTADVCCWRRREKGGRGCVGIGVVGRGGEKITRSVTRERGRGRGE